MRNERIRGSRGYAERSVDTRPQLEKFLIVCEGEKTEPYYFRGFRVPKDVVEVFGTADNTIGVVEEAVERMTRRDYDQVWVVFDRDSFPPDRFNQALALAAQHNIKVAYSNEAFELWYLLHFHFFNTAISRHDYVDKLSRLLGKKYEKGSRTIYNELLSRQPEALKHARNLLKYYDPRDPVRDNPSTTVHLLVEELNQFLR